MIDKDKMKVPSNGNMRTQGLFLELEYGKHETAVYTLSDEHKTYKGKEYPSLKKLYLEMEDPVEYEFATKYLLGWRHWQRLLNNQLVRPYIEEWRDELNLKLRSKAFKEILDRSKTEQGTTANKWIADKGWIKNEVGRPSKADIEQEKAYRANVLHDYEYVYKS